MTRPHLIPSQARRLLAGLALAGGCGYSLVGQGSSLPENIKVVEFTTLENLTQRVGLEQRLVAPQPVYIGRPVVREPVYLWVPPEHRRDWRHHCQRYGACGAPVYFVQDGWYRDHVQFRRDPHDRGWRGPDRRNDWRDDRRDDRHDRRDDWRDDHHGHGHGR